MSGATGRASPHGEGGGEATRPATTAYGNLLPSLPKGGGAIRGIAEKFGTNPATGTGSTSIPIATSPGRGGFGPSLALGYDSGAGNGPFGIGWTLALPAITRKTDRGLPRYRDAEASDVFVISGSEDLVMIRDAAGDVFSEQRDGHRIHRYRPRIEGGFARIERWTHLLTGDVHWRSISPANLTTIYGRDETSRIFDPSDRARVFSWLICETYDDKGHAIVYEYEAETSDGVDRSSASESNRTETSRTAQRYLKRVKYGNRVSRLIEPDLAAASWHFEVVFDYGEDHCEELPSVGGDRFVRASATPGAAWDVRPDPFSRYRAGFELRTYRRCLRVLMFHRFDELGDEPYLVRSTELDYADLEIDETVDTAGELAHLGSTRFASFLRAATHAGYVRDDAAAPVERNGATYLTYLEKALPPVELRYSQAIIQQQVEEVTNASVANLPIGLDGTSYRWVDLDGEGMAGLLSEQGGAWFYKRNTSPLSQSGAQLAPLEHVATLPAGGLGTRHVMDLAGTGALDLVDLDAPSPGFYRRTRDAGWSYRAFESRPRVAWRDPNLRFIDLTGDGSPDLLVTEDEVFTWYESLADQGFRAAARIDQAADDAAGPRLVFADGAQSIHLADLSGDGLTDLVRIRNGEICYWPNLGYGRFGAKVTMDNAPWFDAPEQFDQRRIRLADIDGSGLIDIIYLRADGIRIYFNQSGNRWSDAYELETFPQVNDLSSIAVVDLLGNGTACLVWSSSLANEASRPMRYVRLMADKPYLLTKIVNNMGGEVTVRYAPSTKFYLQDQAAGRPWITKLPFPVHVVEHVETFDHISRNRFASRSAYHHGYFDSVEREFRGFAMVEQWDAESFEDYVVGVARVEGGQELAPELFQPPVLTRTWFHTGAYLEGDEILHRSRDEYYLQQQHLPGAVLPGGLDADELRDCVRALKGMTLRREVYDFDGSTSGPVPYTVTESTYEVTLVQRRGDGASAVFLPVNRESISISYERDAADPRIAHGINLVLGPYGNVLESASIIYGRRTADASLPLEVRRDQARSHVTYVEVDHTDDIDQVLPVTAHRLRVAFETRNYEITGIAPAGPLFTVQELQPAIAAAPAIAYEALASGLVPQKRLVSHNRVVFLDNSLAPLPLGQWDTLGLASQGFKLAFTPAVVAAHYLGKVSDADFVAAGYVHFGDTSWWIPTDTAVYPADPAEHFYIPIGARDPLGIEAIATFDKYDLLVERVAMTQAAWNEQRATNDYRVLGPIAMTDANLNRSAVEIDALGMVVKSAVMGKQGSTDGDTLDDPTIRMEYDAFNWMVRGKPNYIHMFAREHHGAANARWFESYAYSNASGGVAMVKAQAEPGRALQVGAGGTATEVDADPRWIGNGRTVLNNKGNPVKQYEPYFSTTHEYEDERVLRELGSTPVMFYDPVGRKVRTLAPDGTVSRAAHESWKQRVFDANDTVKDSQWYIDRGSPDPALEPEPLSNPDRRAAWLAARHAGTPATVHFDSLARTIYAVADHGGGVTSGVRTEIDLTGRNVRVFDQAQREVSRSFVAMSGAAVFGERAEKGRCWTFQDVTGALVKTWDEHGREIRTEYDELHRPLSSFVTDAGAAEVLFHHVVYGDRHPNAQQLNLLGTSHMIFDQAGMVRIPALNFKGNAARAERILATSYRTAIDWSAVASEADYDDIQAAADSLLEVGEVFTTRGSYDALNRPTTVTLPDGTELQPTYNQGGFLSSLRARIRGQGPFVEFLEAQDYDANGQRLFARYGNDLLTRYFYDAKTFRLTQLLTYPSGAAIPEAAALQALKYTYDPVGNITDVRDDAQQTYYFDNAVVKPESRFTYNAIYQLARATGREHAGGANSTTRDHRELGTVSPVPHPNNLAAVRTYTEEYEYDRLGNLKTFRHQAGAGWTRHYRYAYETDVTDRTNRLASTSQPGDPDAGPYTATYDHDANGNMTRMPHLPVLVWGFLDQLRQVELGGGGTAYYVYAAGGQRMRKVIERNGNTLLEWIFLGAVTIFRRRKRATKAIELERFTVHISDNAGPIAQVDTKTIDTQGADPANPLGATLIRYQYANHLGSAGIETDEHGNVISYEEYHPYGTSSYRSFKPGFDLSLKRYRFSGKERDDESGLYYFGARYYVPWLGRWTSSDPAGFVGGFNLYRYCANNPVMFHDPNGMDERRVLVPHTYTGQEKLEALIKDIPAGYRLSRDVTPQNYQTFWDADRRSWFIAEPVTSPTVPGAGTATGVGVGAVQTHPEGRVKEVAQNFDDAKMRAYNERVQERAIANRSLDPGSTSRTAQLRQANQGQVDNFVADLPGGQRPPGQQVDHTVELQDISRRANTVRPQDHRLQPAGLNASQGASQQQVNIRERAAGVPDDVPAGAVARGTELNDPRLQPGYRARVRWGGYGLMALGPALTLYGSSQVENQAIRVTGYALGAAEGVGAATYVTGRVFMGGGVNGLPGPLGVMRAGSGIVRVAGGAAGIILGTYGLVTDLQNENYGTVPGDLASIVGGGAILAGSAPVAAIAGGVGLANMAGDVIERHVTPSHGRTTGVAAGTLAGAAVGAAAGAAIGVIFFGVGAAPGAAIGAGVGAVVGFIGAYW